MQKYVFQELNLRKTAVCQQTIVRKLGVLSEEAFSRLYMTDDISILNLSANLHL